MYAWIWRQLPGSTVARAALSLLLVLTVCSLLLFVVFPWVDGNLPFTAVTVDR